MSGSDPLRILCLTTLPTLGAGNRLRIEQFAEPLRAMGIHLRISPFFDDAAYEVLYKPGHTIPKVLAVVRGIVRRVRDAARVPGADLVVIYRESAPLGAPLFERLLALLRKPYVFDFDDAIFLAPVHPANQRWAWLRHPSRVTETVRRAHTVITGNEYLASWARQLNPRVVIIPTSVDTNRHHLRPERTAGGPLVLGWVGSSTTAPYLRLLDEAIGILAARLDILVRVVGGRYEHPSATVECLPYRLDGEPADVASFDIGLLPEPDDAWTRGKGAFKALLYMAAGIPVVASRVGVNEEVLGGGEAGMCVDDTAGWVSAIEQLSADPALRARMGARGRDRVQACYSVAVQAPRFADVLRSVALS